MVGGREIAVTSEGVRETTSTEAKQSYISWPYLLAILGMLVGGILPKTWLAHKVVMSCAVALFVVVYRRTPYLTSAALTAVFFPLVEFDLIGKSVELAGLLLIVSLFLFTWLRERQRKRE